MILAAGLGQRMRPLTLTTPKPLLQVAGVPLIEYHIKRLVAAGIRTIVINHAWLGEQIEQHLGDGSRFGAELIYSPEDEPLETAGGIRKALPMLESESGSTFILVNGDVFTNYPFEQLLQGDTEQPHLVLVPNPEHNPVGDFVLEGDKVVTEGELSYTFSGVSRLPVAMFKSLPENEPVPLAPLLRQAIAESSVSGELFMGFWADIGTPERLGEMNILMQEQKIDGL